MFVDVPDHASDSLVDRKAIAGDESKLIQFRYGSMRNSY